MPFVNRVNSGSAWVPTATNLNALAFAANKTSLSGVRGTTVFSDSDVVPVYNNTKKKITAYTPVQFDTRGVCKAGVLAVKPADTYGGITGVVTSTIGERENGVAVFSGVAIAKVPKNGSYGNYVYFNVTKGVQDNKNNDNNGDKTFYRTSYGYPVLATIGNYSDTTLLYILLGTAYGVDTELGQFDTEFYISGSSWMLHCYDSTSSASNIVQYNNGKVIQNVVKESSTKADVAGILSVNSGKYEVIGGTIKITPKAKTYLYVMFLPQRQEKQSDLDDTTDEKKAKDQSKKYTYVTATQTFDKAKRPGAYLITSKHLLTSSTAVVYELIAIVTNDGKLKKCRNRGMIQTIWYGPAYDLWAVTISTGQQKLDEEKKS